MTFGATHFSPAVHEASAQVPGDAHSMPQLPQLSGSLARFVHMLWHMDSPASHRGGVGPEQWPLLHIPESHVMPQPPQLLPLLAVSTQIPPHMVSG